MQITIDEATGGALSKLLAALKEAETPQPCELKKFIELIKVDDSGDAVTILGIVYEPDVVDAQGDWADAPTIAKACERFGLEALPGPHMNLMHKTDLTREEAAACSSYIADADFQIGERKVKKGTWLMKCKVFAAEIKKKIRDGLLKGYSLFGGGAGKPSKIGKRQLTDMNVKNVAIVDSPANMENFLLAKNTKGEPDMTQDELKKLQECIDAVTELKKSITEIMAKAAPAPVPAVAPAPAPAAKADAPTDPHLNADGTFVNGFDGCVAHMMSDGGGHDEDTAKRICGSIAQNAKGILKQADIDAVLATLATEKQAAVEKAMKDKAEADAALVKANAEADAIKKLIDENDVNLRCIKNAQTLRTIAKH